MVSVPSGGWVDDVVNNRTKLPFPSVSYIHSHSFHE